MDYSTIFVKYKLHLDESNQFNCAQSISMCKIKPHHKSRC